MNFQANWIGNYFGPTIRRSKYKKMKIMCNDEARISIYSVYAVRFLMSKPI